MGKLSRSCGGQCPTIASQSSHLERNCLKRTSPLQFHQANELEWIGLTELETRSDTHQDQITPKNFEKNFVNWKQTPIFLLSSPSLTLLCKTVYPSASSLQNRFKWSNVMPSKFFEWEGRSIETTRWTQHSSTKGPVEYPARRRHWALRHIEIINELPQGIYEKSWIQLRSV